MVSLGDALREGRLCGRQSHFFVIRLNGVIIRQADSRTAFIYANILDSLSSPVDSVESPPGPIWP